MASSALEYLPIVDPDFADLDVRDAQNQPVKSLEAQRDLAVLFMENLFALSMLSAPHAMADALEELNLFSLLFNKQFFASLPAIFLHWADAFLPSKKRFVHNVNNLWITLSVGVLLAGLLTRQFCLDRSVHSLPLRC